MDRAAGILTFPFRALDRRMWAAFGMLAVLGAVTYVTNFLLQNAIAVDVSLCVLWIAGFWFGIWSWVLDGADRSSVLGVLGPWRSAFGKTLKNAEAD